jgi:hypothetical protein
MIDDVPDAESFQALDQWALILREVSVVVYTVGNKIDLKEKAVHSQCRSGNRYSRHVSAVGGRSFDDVNPGTAPTSSTNAPFRQQCKVLLPTSEIYKPYITRPSQKNRLSSPKDPVVIGRTFCSPRTGANCPLGFNMGLFVSRKCSMLDGITDAFYSLPLKTDIPPLPSRAHHLFSFASISSLGTLTAYRRSAAMGIPSYIRRRVRSGRCGRWHYTFIQFKLIHEETDGQILIGFSESGRIVSGLFW